MSFTRLSLAILLCAVNQSFTLGFDVILYDNRTVEEGRSMQFECDSTATSPFYYYKYIPNNINPIVIAEREEWPWAVYAINASSSPDNLRVLPSFLAKSEHPLNITNISVDFNNVLVCCQGYQSGKWLKNADQNVTSLSVMTCYRVNVQFSPQIMTPIIKFGEWITPLYPSYGQHVVMSCPLVGNPDALYQWYFEKRLDYGQLADGLLIQPNSSLNITLISNNRILYFEKFEEEHNGRYICNAKNILGSKNFTYFPRIRVYKCNAFDPAKPSVTINASHNLVAYVGNNLTIDCIAASLTQSGNSGIRWFKNESEILPYGRVDYQLGDFDKIHCRRIITLIIKNLKFEDSGNYTCVTAVSDYRPVTDSMLLTVTVPPKQPDYKLLITKISIPVSVVIVLLAICVTIGFFYYLHVRQMKLQKALEEYQKRPLPNKGDYQYEFFFAMTDDDKDKLEVDKLYVVLKQSFPIYYQLDQYLPGRTKVEMVTEGIKNSRFIIIMLSKAYLQQKDETTRLELMYTMNRIQREFTKCAFIISLEDNLFIPYRLRHIQKFTKEGANIKLKELAMSSGLNSFHYEDNESFDDVMELEKELNDHSDTLL